MIANEYIFDNQAGIGAMFRVLDQKIKGPSGSYDFLHPRCSTLPLQ